MASLDQVVVFGGSGFVGSHVADALSEAGYSVRIFDKIASRHLRSDQTMIVGDLLDDAAVQRAVDGCSYIYHFAGISDIGEAEDRPKETALLNVLGTVNVLEAARLSSVKRFVFASTVYVFSDAGSFYRASKQAAERFVETYQSQFGLEYTILRYGSLYGRRADSRNNIFRMLQEAISSRSITYRGDGEEVRDFINVIDAARMSVHILDKSFANRHLVLVGQERMTVKELIRMVAEILPMDIRVELGQGNPASHYALTPYAFNPKLGQKLTLNEHVDLGQGLLDCLSEMIEASDTGEILKTEIAGLLKGEMM